ncbi:MAG TPA: DUF4142 domain-containing protein [Thermoanaerobaculia bacterium]|nr:DUF4142 domain-containing protein [Thermoanaerobaculia bacterium]
MQTKHTTIAALAFASLLTGMTAASAQMGGGGMDPGSPTHSMRDDRGAMGNPALGHADKKFLTEAAQGGMAEVQLGQLAASNASDPDVKAFGQRMVDDHSKANHQLKELAMSKGVALPPEVDRSQKRDYDKLSRLSGPEFDRAYMKMMVSDHKKDVEEFAKEARSARDTDVKAFASSTLPTLQDHLKMAHDTEGKVGHVRSASLHR